MVTIPEREEGVIVPVPALEQTFVELGGKLWAKYCENCLADMMPEDDVWITCPNAGDLCIDCCGENH